jgi:hypothetical protein
MRRFLPISFLAVAAATAATAGAARAADDVAPGTAPQGGVLVAAAPAEGVAPVADDAGPAPAPASAAEPAAASSPPERDELDVGAVKAEGSAAVAAPAGAVAGKAEDAEGAFPLHADATLSNSFGTGWLAPGYQRQPNWSSSVELNGSAGLPKLDFLPKMGLSTVATGSVANWVPA